MILKKFLKSMDLVDTLSLKIYQGFQLPVEDIKHDLFEGGVHTKLKLFLSCCVGSRLFLIDFLNSRIFRHDFAHDNPSPLESASK